MHGKYLGHVHDATFIPEEPFRSADQADAPVHLFGGPCAPDIPPFFLGYDQAPPAVVRAIIDFHEAGSPKHTTGPIFSTRPSDEPGVMSDI